MPQVSNDIFLRGQAVFAERTAYERLQDLLGPAAADTEHELERGPIDERVRQFFELLDGPIEAVIPERFVRHGPPATLLNNRATVGSTR